MSYIFYDTETTGIDKYFDQILQFAAIKTDEDFNIIDKINLRCRLLPFILPSPMALMITGISVDNLQKPELSYYEMAAKLVEKFDEWGASTFIGYNSLSFDENMLRQCFYQSFQPVYYTQMNGNKRADVMKLVLMVYHFDPDAIVFPTDENGKVRFKLDMLCPANGIDHLDAHEAMSDVTATADLMKLIKEKSPDIYQSWWNTSDKNYVKNFVDTHEVFLTTSLTVKSINKPVTKLCEAEGDGETWLFDLNYNPEDYFQMSAEQLAKEIEKKGKGAFLKIRHNAQPALHSNISCGPCSFDDLSIKAKALKGNGDFKGLFAEACKLLKQVDYPNEHIEQKIFSGFVSWKDSAVMKKFHAAKPDDKFAVLNEFDDERLQELGERMLCVDFSDHLPADVMVEFKESVSNKLKAEGDVPFLTIPKAIKDAEAILAKDSSREGFVEGYLGFLRGKYL